MVTYAASGVGGHAEGGGLKVRRPGEERTRGMFYDGRTLLAPEEPVKEVTGEETDGSIQSQYGAPK